MARGSQEHGLVALHIVSAFMCGHNMMLGQWKTDEKSNEITAAPELIDALELAGATVTLDAMGCQKAISQELVDKGDDYAFALQGDQGALHEQVKRLFDMTEWEHYADFAGWGHVIEGAGNGCVEWRHCLALACPQRGPFDACGRDEERGLGRSDAPDD